jgi:uncharacterized membrane protein YdbT with pleckstrin-like domain
MAKKPLFTPATRKQKKAFRKYLAEDEELVLVVGYGLLLGLVLSMLFAYIKCVWEYQAHRYLLTTRRVVIKRGYFAVRLTSALYDKITHLEVDQSFVDRAIMGHGRIIINTAGVHKDVLSLNYVDHPIELKNIMEKLINRERELVGKSHRGEGLPIDGEFVKAK